nr:microtubule nucleation factor SSNA1 [Pan paniscus]
MTHVCTRGHDAHKALSDDALVRRAVGESCAAAQPGRGGREGRRAGFPARSGVPLDPPRCGHRAAEQSPPCRRLGVRGPSPRWLAGPAPGARGWCLTLASSGGRRPALRRRAPALGPQRRPSRPPGIEELCQKREELCRQIQEEEDEKQRLQNEVRQLTEKLARVNENLARKIASRNEFDRTIAETEAAYLKILESSQTLLSVLKREAGNLTKATAPDQKSSGGRDS